MSNAENPSAGGALHVLKHCVEAALNGLGLKTAAHIFIGMEVKEHLHGLSEAWEKQDKARVQEEIIALGNVFLNARTHGLIGLQIAEIEAFLSIGRAFDPNGPGKFETLQLKAIQAIEAGCEPLIQVISDRAFEFFHPDAVPDIRVMGTPVQSPEQDSPPQPSAQLAPDMKFAPDVVTRSGKPSMKFEPMIVTRDDAIAGPDTEFEPMIVTRDEAIAGPDTEFEPMIVTRDDAIAGPDTEFEPMIVTRDDAIAGPGTEFEPMIITLDNPQASRGRSDAGPENGRFYTASEYSRITDRQSVEYHPELLTNQPNRETGPDMVFEPMIIRMDDAPAGPNTQFDIDVVDSSQFMTIKPSDGMRVDSRDRMIIPPAQGMRSDSSDSSDPTLPDPAGVIPEQMLTDTPGYSDTPDIGSLQVPSLDFTNLDLGALSDPQGYLGGDLGPSTGLDYGIAWAGGDFGVGYVGMGGGDFPAFDGGGAWAGDGGWAGGAGDYGGGSDGGGPAV